MASPYTHTDGRNYGDTPTVVALPLISRRVTLVVVAGALITTTHNECCCDIYESATTIASIYGSPILLSNEANSTFLKWYAHANVRLGEL